MLDKRMVIEMIGEDNWIDFDAFIVDRHTTKDEFGYDEYSLQDVEDFLKK